MINICGTALLVAFLSSNASAGPLHDTPGKRWQVELPFEPGTCLSGDPNPHAPSTAFLVLVTCNSRDLRQHFDFTGPSGQIHWTAQPDLCVDEESAGIAPCLPQRSSNISLRQVFAFDATTNVLVSGSRPKNCLRIDWDGAALNPCDSKDPWQQLRAISIPGAVSMASSSSRQLMRVESHGVNSMVHFKATANRSDAAWSIDSNNRRGALKIRGTDNRCLRGASSSCTGSCETVQSGTCDGVEMRFFFEFTLGGDYNKHLKFCVPTSGCTDVSCCGWGKCLEASGVTTGDVVKRKDCSTTNTKQKFTMSYARRRLNLYREIRVEGHTDVCLKLHMHSPYTLSMRTCSVDETGYEKLWKMPFQPPTTTTTTTTTTGPSTTTTSHTTTTTTTGTWSSRRRRHWGPLGSGVP